MQFEAYDPGPPLSDLVESIFHYQHFRPDHSIERVVPTGHLFIIFELDGMERHTYDNETLEPNASFRQAWISGVHRNHLSISAHQDSEMFVIQLKAFGGYPFLHIPMSDLADRVVAGTDVLAGELLGLQIDLLAANGSAEKFSVADAWLTSRYRPAACPPQAVVDVVHILQAEPASKLNEIVDGYSGSQKNLIDLFKKYVGMTPKQYQRVMRFNDVFTQMQKDQFLSWSDIANLCGYSDQSHFIREFKNFSGFNPESYLKQEFDQEVDNFFPLDREG